MEIKGKSCGKSCLWLLQAVKPVVEYEGHSEISVSRKT